PEDRLHWAALHDTCSPNTRGSATRRCCLRAPPLPHPRPSSSADPLLRAARGAAMPWQLSLPSIDSTHTHADAAPTATRQWAEATRDSMESMPDLRCLTTARLLPKSRSVNDAFWAGTLSQAEPQSPPCEELERSRPDSKDASATNARSSA